MGAPSDPLLLLTVPAVADSVTRVRHKVREHLQLFGIEPTGAVELAVGEAVGNAAVHAYPGGAGNVKVAVLVDSVNVEAVVSDHGVGATANPECRVVRYGVVLMKALADRFDFHTAPGTGTTVRMQFALPLRQ